MKSLAFQVVEGNMGAQYHHYLLGIILQNEEGKKFVFNNYMSMLVKHFYDSHGDFAFDGVYSCHRDILDQLIIRGPLEHFHETIQKSIDHGKYVVINVNEENLPCRQAYHHHYFRHDLLIYGYDSQEKTYLTAGFNENMEFCTQAYAYKEVEYAYYTMKNEWDFEFFAFAWNRQYNTELNLKKIITDLSIYIEGENPNRTALEQFLEIGYDSYFIQNSYKEYYGIRLYDYITDRLKGQHKLFRKENSNEVIGVNDLRTINALRAHIHIISELVEYIVSGEKKEELIQKLCDLPEKQHFDHQFKPVLSMIKPKMKKTYDVYSGIQIKVSSAVEDLEDIIEAYEDGDGKRYLKIRMDNDITFRTFERREGR